MCVLGKLKFFWNASDLPNFKAFVFITVFFVVIKRYVEGSLECQRPYCVENTGSLPNSEVKHRKARIVLGWVTAREVLRVLLAFLFIIVLK